MPPPLPDRYRLEVRLGRDDDIEEWLATDSSLDRPVLIRILGPETSEARRNEFLAAVRGAAAATGHMHLVQVYAAAPTEGGAYSVSEWAGGLTLQDRIAAGTPLDVDEFLPNAAGLASALAALHDAGELHGSITLDTIYFSAAHPAKLGAFGRRHTGATTAEDVRDLASSLDTALTGRAPGSVPPSQVVDGIGSATDDALARAREGRLDAARLSDLLRSAPSAPTPAPPGARWKRWPGIVAASVVLALGLIAAAAALTDDPPPLIIPAPTTPKAPPPSGADRPPPPEQPDLTPPATIEVSNALSFDPPPGGDEREHDDEVGFLIDGDLSTVWKTEGYLDPISLLKPGVGVVLKVQGTPTDLEILGISPGATFTLYWRSTPSDDLADWEQLATGRSLEGSFSAQVPPRSSGSWLIWLTELPSTPEGVYRAEIAEVRFRS